MRATIRLRLVAGTRLPKRIRGSRTKSVRITSEVVRGRRVRLLEMRGGRAHFWPGDRVIVRAPGSGLFWDVIPAEKVLEIKVIRPAPQLTTTICNYHLCTECYTNTSAVVNHKPAAIAGRQEFALKCTVCGHERTQVV